MKFPRPNSRAAFTMIEIAMALAVIGFALVAIIGILPMGIDVQKNNRRETIVNQDANYWIDAIRNGARGLDDLTNYVAAITIRTTAGGVTTFRSYTNDNPALASFPMPSPLPGFSPTFLRLDSGTNIIGLLTTPEHPNATTTNYVVAYVQALSGAAIEKTPQSSDIIKGSAFGYKLVSEVVPYGSVANTFYDSSWTNFLDTSITLQPAVVLGKLTNWVQAGQGDPDPKFAATLTAAMASNPAEVAHRAHAWLIAKNMNVNAADMRLLFRWPLLPGFDDDGYGNKVPKIGTGRQGYRFMVGSSTTNFKGTPLYFFLPQTFSTNRL